MASPDVPNPHDSKARAPWPSLVLTRDWKSWRGFSVLGGPRSPSGGRGLLVFLR